MKKITLLFIFCLFTFTTFAQFNITYKSRVDFDYTLSDIWGYAAPDGREYALVGLQDGVSIIDVTDAENPVLKGHAEGPWSSIRDIKTWGHYAFVTNEGNWGLLAIDLSNLPNELTPDDYFYWAPEIDGTTLKTAHNLFIDEYGIAYLTDTNLASGVLYVDVNDPDNLQYLGSGGIGCHDVFVRNNIMYLSCMSSGTIKIYDVTDKSNTLFLNSQETVNGQTHNAWLSDDSNFVFTTGESGYCPVGAYDISNLNNIGELDQFYPILPPGQFASPHNVLVWNDWLTVSYYTEGCIILDGSRPENLIEVGNFKNYWPDSLDIYAWGVYPYLPSGTLLVSDRSNGCLILEPNYVRACWLEGVVTDEITGFPIIGVEVEILSSQTNMASTDPKGSYKTGQAIAGTFDVIFSHPDYLSDTVEVTLENGILIILDVQLGIPPTHSVTGTIIRASDGTPIPGASVLFGENQQSYETTTDGAGNFTVSEVWEGDYTVYAGAWGFINTSIISTVDTGTGNIIIELEEGYADDFIVDLGWTVVNETVFSGAWTRGEPIGTIFYGNQSNPEYDVDSDLGDHCYMTGLGGGDPDIYDVDNGSTELISPPMDLTDMNFPVLRFRYWFFNDGWPNGNQPDDLLIVKISNGIEVKPLTVITSSQSHWSEPKEIDLSIFIEMTDNMQVLFYTFDQVGNNTGHIVEAAIDEFSVYDADPTSLDLVSGQNLTLNAYPNPFAHQINVDYTISDFSGEANLNVYNMLGQLVHSQLIVNERDVLEINEFEAPGLYFIQLEMEGKLSEAMKVVKQ